MKIHIPPLGPHSENCSMMTRWHHSDSVMVWSREQENAKTFCIEDIARLPQNMLFICRTISKISIWVEIST